MRTIAHETLLIRYTSTNHNRLVFYRASSSHSPLLESQHSVQVGPTMLICLGYSFAIQGLIFIRNTDFRVHILKIGTSRCWSLLLAPVWGMSSAVLPQPVSVDNFWFVLGPNWILYTRSLIFFVMTYGPCIDRWSFGVNSFLLWGLCSHAGYPSCSGGGSICKSCFCFILLVMVSRCSLANLWTLHLLLQGTCIVTCSLVRLFFRTAKRQVNWQLYFSSQHHLRRGAASRIVISWLIYHYEEREMQIPVSLITICKLGQLHLKSPVKSFNHSV